MIAVRPTGQTAIFKRYSFSGMTDKLSAVASYSWVGSAWGISTGNAGASEAGADWLRISELTASLALLPVPRLMTSVLAMARTRMKPISHQVAFSRMVAVWRTPRAWFAEVKLVASAVLAVLQEDDHDQQDGREDNQDDQDGECDVHI